MMKKLVISLVLLLVLCACGKTEPVPAVDHKAAEPETVDLMPGAEPENSAVTLYVYDGQSVHRRYLFETEETRRQLMEQFHYAQVTRVQTDLTQLQPPFYGIEIGAGDLGQVYGLWSDGCFITKTGEIYGFEYDFEKLLSDHPWSEPDAVDNIGLMPCAKYVACTETGWNTAFLTEAQPLDPPQGIEMQLKLNGTDAAVTFTNHTEEEWGYGLDFGLQVLVDDVWYYVPAEQSMAFCEVLMLLQPGASAEETYSIASYGELPAGTYRFVTQHLSEEFILE